MSRSAVAVLGLHTCTQCADPYDPIYSSAQGVNRFCSEDCEEGYYFTQGREAGARDRFLGEESTYARVSPLPGYGTGYAKGRRGE